MLSKGAETLPAKAAKDYKALAKLYDAKNYRRGLKNAEKILQTHPDHPQTIAMKALFELGLGEEAKAEVTAKLALMKSKMASMFCWHTYGSVHKQKKNFPEAAKCFQMALNFEKDNLQLLRETASLQIQVRDHNSHVATRLSILKLKPNLINNWVSFAVAQHLKGDFEQLYKALTSIENLRVSAQMKPVQISNYLIYRAIAYEDGQKIDKMYEQLTKNKAQILDEDVWNELMYRCCMKLKKPDQAQNCIEFLIKKYPQNLEYMKLYQQINNISDSELYKKMRTEFKSKIAKIYEICTITDKNQFKKEFSAFIKPYFQKNLISLFAEIQVIYEKTTHSDAIEQVFLQHEVSLKNNTYPDGTAAQFPTQYLWSLYLLAQHYSLKYQTLDKAYAYIKRTIEHTDTVTEFYIVKAQIEYKMHNNLEALKTINEARKTDLADRYMNNICIKFLLKCMKPHLAEEVLKLFMRDEASLYELQNQWYIIEAAKSFIKMRNFPAGLRHFYFVEKQFQDIEANQYDFHTYCIRKWTLKEYLQYISFNDNIFKDKKYTETAGYAIQNLIEYDHVLQAEAKKPKQQQKQTKQQQQTKKKKNKKKAKQTNEEQELPPVEQFRKKIDYFGKEYAERIKANPMQEAFIYAKNVTSAKYVNKQNRKQNKLYSKAFSNSVRVFIHANKPMLVIKALKKLVKTQHDAYLTLLTSVRAIIFLQAALANEKTPELSREFIKEYLNQLLGQSKTVQQLYKAEVAKLPQVFNKNIRVAQIELALKGQDTRENLINLYKNQLQEIIAKQSKENSQLQLALSLSHRLQFYGQLLAQFKQKLNQQFGQQTSYFTNWFDQIDKLPQSTWGMFWLSDYDIAREEQDDKKKEEEKNGEKEGEKKQELKEEAKTA